MKHCPEASSATEVPVCYSYAALFTGTQRSPGGAFVADPDRDSAVDWGCMAPTATGLDLANGTQYGCCPKTVATPDGRRI
eukprot:3836795-Prymnesium_polylepis.1